MEKKIRSELMTMSAMVLMLLALGIYARKFVYDGVMAKPEINLMIFGLTGFATYLAFRHVRSLRNEVLALKALQVDFGSRRRRPVNPYKNPAIVFHEPVLLGQGYRMISEELGKQEDLNISNATVQTLLHDVDQRINDRRSTIVYFSGLMVFLGLLGAFMGLMKTVHSVSDLIAAMDLSGKSGADGIARMIEGMKAPLHGMSVGFSSSLFGLMTSMVLGALERCMTSAMKALRNEFEHWLSNVAALEGGPQTETSAKVDADFLLVKRALEMGGRQLKEVRDTVVAACTAENETRRAVSEMAGAVERLSRTVETLADPRPLLAPITDAVADLARNQTAMLTQFKGLYDQADADRTHIRAMLDGMRRGDERLSRLDADLIHRQLERMVALQADIAARDPVIVASSGDPGTATASRGWLSGLLGARGKDTGAIIGESRAIRGDVRRGLLGQRRLLRQIAARLGRRLDRIEAGNATDRDSLAALLARAVDQQARLETLAARLDEAAPPASYDAQPALRGAREELEHLQRRLNAAIGEDDRTTPDLREGAPRASGTEG